VRLPAGLRGASWSAIDQGIYSLSNVVLAILVARQVTAEEFGAFSTVYILYVCSQGVNEGIHGEAFAVAYSAAGETRRRSMLAGAAASALGFGAALGLVCLLAGVVVPGPIGDLLPILGVVLPGLFLQDLWRFALFAEGLPRAAALNDLVWGGGSTVAIVVLARTSLDTVGWFLFAWGAAGAVAAVVGAFQLRVVPHLAGARRWIPDHRALGLRYAAEFMLLYGTTQVVVLFLGAVAGLDEVAKVRGAQILFGPIYALYAGVRVAFTPTLVRTHAEAPERTGRLVRLLAAGLGLVTLVWGLVAVNLPDAIGEALLGDSWAGTTTVLGLMTWSAVAGGIGFAFVVGLRAHAAARRSLRARGTVAVATLVLGCAGALVAAARGAVAGIAVAETAGVGVYGRAFAAAEGPREEGPGDDEDEVPAPTG